MVSAPLKVPTLILIMDVYALCYVLLKIGIPYSPPLLFGGLRIMLGGSRYSV